MSRTTGYAIVSGHKDRTFLVLCSPASRSWRALRPETFKSTKLPKTASQGSARSKQPRRAPPAAGHRRLVLARCRPRPNCPRAPPAAAQASSPGLAGVPLGRFQTRWRRGAGADGTPCWGRKAARIAPNSGSPRAWASKPSCGGGMRSQPTLPARRAPGGAWRRAGGAARARRAHCGGSPAAERQRMAEKRRLERKDRWMAPHQDRVRVFTNTVLSQPTCPA